MKAKRTTARRLCLGTCLPSQPQPSLPCPSTLPQPILLLDLSPGPDVHIEVSPQKNPSACFPSRVQAALISCRELNKASLASHSPGWNSLALAYPLSFESLEATRWSRWGGRDLASNPSSAMTSQETLGKYSNSTASFPHPHTGSNAVHPTRCEDRSLPRYRPAHAGSGGFNAAVYLFWLICGASRLLLPRARPQEP